jgi:peroxiredoxin
MKKTPMLSLVTAAIATLTITSLASIDIGGSLVDADITMKSVDGSMVSINDVKGEKGTLVIFTCNHCPFVIGWQDRMVELGNSCKNKGIGVIFINSNDPSVKGDTFEGMQELAKKEGYQFPYAVDDSSAIARNFGAKKTPDVFLFNAQDKLVYQGAVGEGGRKPAAGGEPYLQNALDALAAGKPVETPKTKAVGCSIKFR